MSSRLIASLGAVVLATLVGGTAVWTLIASRSHTCDGSAVAGGSAAIGGPFELVDGTGATVRETDVIDEPSLFYFGYTFCPDVCPFDVARNVLAVDLLAEQGIDVKPVFVSIDPERDTPEVMAAYAENMHPKMVALTGSADQVKEASLAYKVFYSKGEGDDEYYLMNHSTFTYLMMPNAGFATYFGRDVSPEVMAEQTACFVDALS